MYLDAQDVTNFLTLALATATVWLAVATQKMASATKEAVTLQSRPYLSFDGVSLGIGRTDNLVTAAKAGIARPALLLSNPGQVLVTYEVEELAVTFAGASIAAPHFYTRGGVIQPKGNAQFYYPAMQLPEDLKPGQSGDIAFRIAFWTTQHEVHRLSAKVCYTLNSVEPGTPGAVEWLYLDGPSYT